MFCVIGKTVDITTDLLQGIAKMKDLAVYQLMAEFNGNGNHHPHHPNRFSQLIHFYIFIDEYDCYA